MKAAAIGGGPMFSSMKRHTQGLLRVRSATLGGDRARVGKRRIHLRGAVGFGRVQEDTDSDSWELPFYGTALGWPRPRAHAVDACGPGARGDRHRCALSRSVVEQRRPRF